MRAVRLAVAFVDAARPRGPAAAAEIVQCDDVETIGINRLARADAVVPPAGFAIVRVMDASGVMITGQRVADQDRSEEHTSELQSLMRISYAVFCLKKKKQTKNTNTDHT